MLRWGGPAATDHIVVGLEAGRYDVTIARKMNSWDHC